ncbi:MAG: site-specific integrase [Acidobacteriota bacterium]
MHPSGGKAWAFRYRFAGRTRKLTLGEYPAMTLAAARAAAHAARKDLAQGIDPATREPELEERGPDLFGAVAAEFVERWCKPRNRSWREQQRILEKDAVPRWGRRDIRDIRRADVLRLLDDVESRAPVAANRLHATLARLFRWAVERGYLERSPMEGVRAPAPEQSRDRVLSDEELTDVLRAADSLSYPWREFLLVLVLTAQRRGEVADMTWQQVDLERGLWTLPAEATKAGRVHDVPLVPAAVDILAGLPRWEGPFVFTTTGGRKPLSDFSGLKARLDRRIAELRRAEGRPATAPWRMHDLRRTAATWLARHGVAPHVLSALLNHSPGRNLGITAVYVRTRWLEERRQALEAWAAHVLGLLEERREVAHA